jgi:ketosteroid isomerase-like protein
MSTPVTDHPNAALVRRGYEAFNTADMKTLTEIIDESASWHTPGRSPLAGDHQGPRGGLCPVRPVWAGYGRKLPGRVAARARG